MKKIYLIIVTLLFTSWVFAQGSEYKQDNVPPGLLGTNLQIVTYTSEPCWIAGEKGGEHKGQMGRYKCYISASNGFIEFISSIYKYVFFISLVIGVLLIVVLGIGMSISGVATEEIKSKAKSKIMDVIIGLIALALIPWILKTIAPFFFK
jgi:Type IV secretion system pilin